MGSVSTEIPGLKLIVRKSDDCARYVILQRAGYGVVCRGHAVIGH